MHDNWDMKHSDPLAEKMFLGLRFHVPSHAGGVMVYVHHASDKAGVYGRWIRSVNHLWLRAG